ncbi:MAG: ABC transporter permease [Achromobacter sp.]|jgi:peptide/nickel transport system permease protein|uniref:Glutathione transport system permease protein GsiD n=1 Tax=Achromobacter insuavis TaxID=1287735 RepID=A0A6J5HE88_9BURK|nr:MULTISPECIES: ABC transporter permease [Achromobacter]MBN9639301.1 ABC transporter permease [Achromobacter sp.]CAB3718289.1 Glutathione transport system permease protein GsiD [Achromobacter insuavis]CAB3834306.1 Glutathione transport system permease protein GsiD [Achromobacter insuavis]CUI41297.1 Glutathione transport system permease protein gsiD [Achromobacter sp. 2789STDY5608628]CUI48656.1 Glutathione transport system permease protein gsiD [Achromobacter sp. 2789STDY5608633]
MTVQSASAPAPAAPLPRLRRGALGRLLANPAAVAGALLLLLILLAALTAPWVFPHDPLDMVGPPILWPGQDHEFWLGTDTMGRDVAAGLAHGARVSLTVGVTAALLSLVIGIAIGAAAGYFGGWVDVVLMRVTELLQTIPAFLLVVVIVAIARPSVTVIALSIGVASWPVVARLVRAEFRTLRESEFVQAARSLGFSHARIALLEILPNALPPVIVTTSVLVANAILMESALSFMNMGDPNAVSWGSMIGDAREMLRTAWYLAALPGVSIILTVLSLNLLGDALNDAFNPRLSR